MKRRFFTLIEVLVALAVLTLGILALTGLVSSAQRRGIRAEEQWSEQHALSQAAEYFLLAGAGQDIPERFFPFPDYRISVRLNAPLNLPPDVSDRIEGWQLFTMHLVLQDEKGKSLRELSIDRIVETEEQ